MRAERVIKRWRSLLKKLATLAKGRHDIPLPLPEIAPSLTGRSGRFVDKEQPDYKAGSDLAYDFNTLKEEGLIELVYLAYDKGRAGEAVPKNPAVQVRPEGLEVVAELNKPWLRSAIEKQPMTFVQVIVTILLALVTGIGGWVIGRYVTPVHAECSQPQIRQPCPDKTAAGAQNEPAS